MLLKTFFIVFLATFTVSFAKEDDIVKEALGSGTNILKGLLRLASDDAEKYALDFNDLYKKYEVEARAEQAKSFLETQFKRGAELTNDYFKKVNVDSEETLKKAIELIKKEDSVLGDKLSKFYEKSCDLDRISEDIVKYVLDVNKVNGAADKVKSALGPLEHKLIDSVKKFEAIVLEHVPKKGKGHK